MHRHPTHRDRLSPMGASRRQRDAQRGRRPLRVFKEQLVEVAHAKEHQGIGLPRLGLEILRHHGGGAGRIDRNWDLSVHGQDAGYRRKA